MVQLFSAPGEEVMQRLWLDPGLAPLALEAAERARTRKRNGKVMTILGWTTAGLGLTTLAMSFMPTGFTMSCGDGCQTTENRPAGMDKVRGIAIFSFALGLGVAIPGMAAMARTSDIEKQAIRRYQQLGPGLPRPPAAAMPP
jgi:hypothetical protein